MIEKNWDAQLTPEKLTMIMGHAMYAGSTAIASHPQSKELYDYDLCGFAWLYLKLRKNHRLASTLSDIGWTFDDYKRHWVWWGSRFGGAGQSIQLKEAGVSAAKEVLRRYGIPAYSGSRLD